MGKCKVKCSCGQKGGRGRTKRCSGLAIKWVLMENPRSRAADRNRSPALAVAPKKEPVCVLMSSLRQTDRSDPTGKSAMVAIRSRWDASIVGLRNADPDCNHRRDVFGQRGKRGSTIAKRYPGS